MSLPSLQSLNSAFPVFLISLLWELDSLAVLLTDGTPLRVGDCTGGSNWPGEEKVARPVPPEVRERETVPHRVADILDLGPNSLPLTSGLCLT